MHEAILSSCMMTKLYAIVKNEINKMEKEVTV